MVESGTLLAPGVVVLTVWSNTVADEVVEMVVVRCSHDVTMMVRQPPEGPPGTLRCAFCEQFVGLYQWNFGDVVKTMTLAYAQERAKEVKVA